VLGALLLAGGAGGGVARADDGGAPARPAVLKDRPCPGCMMSLPPGSEPVPLLLLLHGDGQSASVLFAKWQRHAEKRGIAVLALQCPRSLGCGASWWQWNGPPSWLRERIADLEAVRPIDRSRLWLAGWSGGATYTGYRSQELQETFAAFVFHGGGMRPSDPACGPGPINVYFVEGTLNPFHTHAVWLKEHYLACPADVQWVVLKGADHDAEWAALDGPRARTILDWLATKRRDVAPPDAGPSVVEPLDAEVRGARVTATDVLDAAPDIPGSDAAAPGPPPVPRSCRCGTVGGRDGEPSGTWPLALAIAAVATRQLRGSRRRACRAACAALRPWWRARA
jgi:poly(3-hydroxybutyrate) depolymerase